MAGGERNNGLSALFAGRRSATGDPHPVTRALQVIRGHLSMDVAYVSELCEGRSVLRYVETRLGHEDLMRVGQSRGNTDAYCQHILGGRLPEIIGDTKYVPLAQTLLMTHKMPVGAHIAAPIRLRDGTLYGVFAAFSTKPKRTLNERDHHMLCTFADIAAGEIAAERAAKAERADIRARLGKVFDGNQMVLVYQPIWDLHNARPVGLEALSRILAEPVRSPSEWFADADAADETVWLENAAVQRALARVGDLPRGAILSINVSPKTVLSEGFGAVLAEMPLERIVLELNEGVDGPDYDAVADAVAPLRGHRLTIAVDNAGRCGNFHHLSALKPDIIKAAMSVTRGIDTNANAQAMLAALVGYGRQAEARLGAVGVETQSELVKLCEAGIDTAQGFLLGKPLPFEEQALESGAARDIIRSAFKASRSAGTPGRSQFEGDAPAVLYGPNGSAVALG